MPRNLSAEAQKFWRAHAPDLEKRGCLTKLDGMAFASVCESYSMIRLIEETLQRDGILVTGPRGKISPHPLVRERARWERNFIAAARDFGMTPSSRRRLGIVEPDP
jgi:P27 family predicted phage terminase small subunit